jgi:hypothetical protein
MKKINVFIIFVSVYFITGCVTESNNQEFYTVDFTKAKYKDYGLSEMMDSLDYVYLTEPLVWPVMKYDVSEHYMIVGDRADRVLLYHRNGKFICEAGKYGRGPGEHQRLQNLAIDEPADRVYVLDQTGHLFQYDLTGAFKSKIKLEADSDNLAVVSSGTLITHVANWEGNKSDRFMIRNGNDGAVVRKFGNPFRYALQKRLKYAKEMICYRYNGQLCVKDKSDTLFTVSGDSLTPRFVLVNNCSVHQENLTQTAYDHTMEFLYFFESEKRLYFIFQDCQQEYRQGFYDKQEEQVYLCNLDNYSVPNDIDGGAYDNWHQNNVVFTPRMGEFEEEELTNASPDVKEKINAFKKTYQDEDPSFMVIGYLK